MWLQELQGDPEMEDMAYPLVNCPIELENPHV